MGQAEQLPDKPWSRSPEEILSELESQEQGLDAERRDHQPASRPPNDSKGKTAIEVDGDSASAHPHDEVAIDSEPSGESIDLRSSISSPAEPYRRPGSFARQRRTIWARAGGMSGRCSSSEEGSS